MPRGDLVLLGLVAGAVVAAIALLPLGRFSDPLRWAAIAAAAALYREDLASDRVVVAVAVAAAASLLGPVWLRLPAAIAAALPLAGNVPFDLSDDWTVAVGACILGAAALVARAEHVAGRPFVAVCLTVTLAGIYAGPPDTEVTTVVGAVTGIAAAAVVILPWQRRANLAGATIALVGLTCWTAIVESGGRLAAFPAAIACFGVLLADPVARAVTGRTGPLPRRSTVVLFAAHVAAVGVASRVAAPETDLTRSTIIAAVALLEATVVAVAVSWLGRKHDVLDLREGEPEEQRSPAAPALR